MTRDTASGPWRRPDFVRLFAASTTSSFGTMMSAMAVPWLAIDVLAASDGAVAGIATLRLLPALVLGVLAGAWLDRVRKRPVLIAADLGRAALYAAVPALYFGGWLDVRGLAGIVTAVAALSVVFQVGVDALLPALVPRATLLDANAALTGGEATAESVGFLASGWVARWLGTPLVFAIDAVTFLASAACLSRISAPEASPRARPRGGLGAELRAGFTELAQHPELRAIAAAEALRGAAFGIFMATYMLWLLRELGVSKEWIGTIAFTGSLGSVVGSSIVVRLCDAIGRRRAQTVSLVCAAGAYLLVPLAPNAAWLGIACLIGHQIVGDAFDTMWQIASVSTRQELAHPERMGRVHGAVASLASASQCAAAAACTAVIPWSGPRALLFVAAALPALAAVVLASRRRAVPRPA